METSFYKDSFAVHLALHCLFMANHKDNTFFFNHEQITIRRGQFLTGRNKLSFETGMKSSTVRNKLVKLSKTRFLTIKTTNRFSIITINNYNTYQSKQNEAGQQIGQPKDSRWTADEQQMDTNKKLKKLKNDKNKVKYHEFVFLTVKEYEKLIERFGKELTDEKIENLNNGIGSKGYKYKSHYHTILSWDRKDKKDDSKKTNTGEIDAINCSKYYGRGNCPFQGAGRTEKYCKYCKRYKKKKQ